MARAKVGALTVLGVMALVQMHVLAVEILALVIVKMSVMAVLAVV